MPQVSLATINLRNSADRWSERRHLLVAQILDASPDLISLQEISFPIRQGVWLRNQINARLTERSGRAYRLVQRRKRHLYHGYFEGIGILSRLPIVDSDLISLGYGGRLALRANVETDDKRSLDFVCVHLHHVASDREAREEQAMKLCGWLQNYRRMPHQIIAGDFNEVPGGPAIQYMKQTYRSAYEDVHGREPLATFPTALVERSDGWSGCLDYIFLSPAVQAVTAASIFCDQPSPEDGSLYPSDHVGILAKVEL